MGVVSHPLPSGSRVKGADAAALARRLFLERASAPRYGDGDKCGWDGYLAYYM